MSFLDTAKRALSAKGTDEYEDDRDYEYEDEYEEKKPRKSIFSFLTGKTDDDYEDEYEEEAPVDEPVVSKRSSYHSSYSSSDRYSSRYSSTPSKTPIKYNPPVSLNAEVILITLTNFDDSEKIVREVKSGKITIFDVSEIDSTEDARRIVDYISGAAAGMECPFSRLCHGIFCIAPKGVTLTTKKSRYM